MKKTNNKGFSLVELIIVVAIMAVLVGVLAPQYIKYLDKSKAGTDRQMLDNLRQAITTTILDPDLTKSGTGAPTGAVDWTAITANSVDTTKVFWKEVFEIMGKSPSDLVTGLSYKSSVNNASPTIQFKIDGKKNVGVRILYTGSVNGDSYDFEIE